ncbi:MFS transporter [Methylopila sp. M107]|uniref:MFS transporter n=1 Tax=Methylopila sp. M107 TaxID=1101190 RepID=UPI000374B24E|nr:MFS transporter [Methylopila sp. M107]
MERPPDIAGEGATSLRAWLAIVATSIAGFSIVTAEMLPVGVLALLAADLGVAEGVAGRSVTVPGLVAAVAALAVVLGAGRFDRRLLIFGLVGMMALANVASALVADFGALLFARVFVGVSVGGFWALAAWLPGRIVAPRDVARATALAFAGVSAALVLGVPFGSEIGSAFGWRASFLALSALTVVALVGLMASLPPLPAPARVSVSELASLLRDAVPRAGLAATFLLVAGHYAAYTYVALILAEHGLEPRLIGSALLIYGIAGIAGNVAAGALAGRNPRRLLPAIAAAIAIVLGGALFVSTTPASALALLAMWGALYGGAPVAVQMWMASAAPDRAQAASAAWVSIASGAIGLGAYLGGLLVDGVGVRAAIGAAACAMLLAAVVAGRRVSPATFP